MQMEKEKQNYDFDNVQSQLDKALGQAARMQKEREAIQLEVDRLTDKYEKAQVKIFIVWPIWLADFYDYSHGYVVLMTLSGFSQVIVSRLQKDRDNLQEEVSKLQRDKDNALSELDLVKERWEKAHNSHQKLTVSI